MTAATTASQLMNLRGSVDPWGKDRGKAAELAGLREKMNQEARDNWDSEIWHRQVAAEISNVLDYQFTFENVFQTYFRTENVGEWDQFRLRERRGMKVFFTSRGGRIEESQIRVEDWTLPRDTIGFHVSEHIDKLRMNFSETIEGMVALGSMRLEAEVNRRIFTMLQEAVTISSPYYVGTAGLTKPEVDTALRGVRDAIKPNGEGPVPVTIIGRAAMVDKISDFNMGFDPEATAEIRARGRLGIYRNATVQQVINYTDDDGLSYIPANELWIFGGDVGRFAFYGGMQVNAWRDEEIDFQHYKARKDLGGLVHHPEQSRRIVDSSVSP